MTTSYSHSPTTMYTMQFFIFYFGSLSSDYHKYTCAFQ